MGRTVPTTDSTQTALSIEFVSKPQEVYRLPTAIPAAIERALGEISGFAGCLVLISDKEPRLVTVITLWEGENRAELSRNVAGWLQKIVAPFLDHCLQVRSHHAYAPMKSSSSHMAQGDTPKEDFSACPA